VAVLGTWVHVNSRHGLSLQVSWSRASPTQGRPPWNGPVHSRVRTLMPPPHVTSQLLYRLQSPQTPSTTHSHSLIYAHVHMRPFSFSNKPYLLHFRPLLALFSLLPILFTLYSLLRGVILTIRVERARSESVVEDGKSVVRW